MNRLPPGSQSKEVHTTMKKQLAIAFATTFLLASPLALACDYPSRADMPNGNTASKEEMLDGQRSIKTYMAAMDEYLACIDQREKDAVAALVDPSDDELASREAAITKKYNAAVEEMELTAARFNEQVRSYNAQKD
jgi:hypothetical protein